jgi:hypothetical protein
MTTYPFGSTGLDTAHKVAAILKKGGYESDLGKKDGVIILTTQASEAMVTAAYNSATRIDYPVNKHRSTRNPDDGRHMDPYAEAREERYY